MKRGDRNEDKSFKFPDAISAYKNNQVKKANNNLENKINDKLDLSENAKIYAKAMNALKETNLVRADKVNQLKSEIQNGTYSVDSGKVAEKILKGINIDDKA